jgi:hypothetical protein
LLKSFFSRIPNKFIKKSIVILQKCQGQYPEKENKIFNYKKPEMLKKLLSLLLGGRRPKPAYAYVPKQQNAKLPQKRRN